MKILYTATVLSHICQFHLPHIEMLKNEGHEVHVAAYDNLKLKNGLQLKFADSFTEIPFERSPLKTGNIKAYKKLKSLIGQEHYDVIVCNTPVGGIITRLAAVKARKQGTGIIYIAHGFHFFKGAPIKNFILYYPLEKIMSRLCDKVVTVNFEDYERVKGKFRSEICHIHGVGVRSERFYPHGKSEQAEMRKSENIETDDFVILCVGELNENKNQKTVISAAGILKNEIKNLKVLLAGNGPLENKLKKQVTELGLENTVRFLGYRTDLEMITPFADVIVSASGREGMPLNIIEGMLCGKPVIASVNRGHNELVSEENGFVFERNDYYSLSDHIRTLYLNPELAVTKGEKGYMKAQKYTVENVKYEMKKIIIGV